MIFVPFYSVRSPKIREQANIESNNEVDRCRLSGLFLILFSSKITKSIERNSTCFERFYTIWNYQTYFFVTSILI